MTSSYGDRTIFLPARKTSPSKAKIWSGNDYFVKEYPPKRVDERECSRERETGRIIEGGCHSSVLFMPFYSLYQNQTVKFQKARTY